VSRRQKDGVTGTQVNRAAEQQSSRAAEQQSSRAAEQQSSSAAEQQKSRESDKQTNYHLMDRLTDARTSTQEQQQQTSSEANQQTTDNKTQHTIIRLTDWLTAPGTGRSGSLIWAVGRTGADGSNSASQLSPLSQEAHSGSLEARTQRETL